MGHKNKSSTRNDKLDLQANAWFDRIDDRQPFDAFGNPKNKRRIGDDIFNRIQSGIQRKKTRAYLSVNIGRLKLITTTSYVMRIAASVILISGIALIFWNIKSSLSPKQEFITFQTPKGRKGKIALPDGSTIWVNSGSKIRYLKQFQQNVREIYLDSGEAFFQVKHDKNKAFIVHAGLLNTQVLGTSFNIQLNVADRKTIVTVNTGKVAVFTRTSNKPVKATMLIPNQKAVYELSTGIITSQKADAYSSANWIDNVLVLRKADLYELKTKLENWYNVKISYKNTIDKRCLITAKFDNQPLLSVLNSIKIINGYDFKIIGDQVIINNKPCN